MSQCCQPEQPLFVSLSFAPRTARRSTPLLIKAHTGNMFEQAPRLAERGALPKQSALCLYLFCELEDCDAMILTLTRHTSVLEQYLILCLLEGFLVCGIPQKQTILQSSKQYLV